MFIYIYLFDPCGDYKRQHIAWHTPALSQTLRGITFLANAPKTRTASTATQSRESWRDNREPAIRNCPAGHLNPAETKPNCSELLKAISRDMQIVSSNRSHAEVIDTTRGPKGAIPIRETSRVPAGTDANNVVRGPLKWTRDKPEVSYRERLSITAVNGSFQDHCNIKV